MRSIGLVCVSLLLAGCGNLSVTTGSSISSEELETFFRKHSIDGNPAVALKKSSLGTASYLATIHGYPNNLQVCESLIEPYNRDQAMSSVAGTYYCQALR